jgi:hypothetical protein
VVAADGVLVDAGAEGEGVGLSGRQAVDFAHGHAHQINQDAEIGRVQVSEVPILVPPLAAEVREILNGRTICERTHYSK